MKTDLDQPELRVRGVVRRDDVEMLLTVRVRVHCAVADECNPTRIRRPRWVGAIERSSRQGERIARWITVLIDIQHPQVGTPVVEVALCIPEEKKKR